MINFKKTGFYILILSILLVTAVGVGKMTNPKENSSNGATILQQAMDYFLWEIEPSMGQSGEFYTGRYRILSAEEKPENVIVYAWVVSKWIDSKGRIVSGGSGIYEIFFAIENDLYIYEFMRNIKIPEDPYIPRGVSDIVRNDGEAIYAELKAEIEEDIQNYLMEK